MIPRLHDISAVQSHYLHFFRALENAGFEGEICPDFANRTALSTDNSIYQIYPQGVVYPRNIEDLVALTSLANQPEYHFIEITARGGGTGTNGQSLNNGIIVDLSRHMNQILEVNAEQGWVRVQTGVVKDQLNAILKPHGLFFAPDTSTSNRATIGGMINTDASGQGSCKYGKTRDHVIELTTVLADGEILNTKALSDEELAAQQQLQCTRGLVYRVLDNIEKENAELIKEKFPKLNRCLTGYDLAHIRDDNKFNVNNILCGSEGTLGIIVEAKLNVVPLPKHSAIVIVNYSSFDSALRDAPRLMQAGPTSIETIDSTILNLAINDPNVWQDVQSFFTDVDTSKIQGMNLVEYTGSDRADLSEDLAKLISVFKETEAASGSIGHALAWGDDAVKKIWNMRKKAVGLLGNFEGEARPVAFVEDTAVPPENLADYILEFREILESHNLRYGMFGHVDAGVLHVRPALDLKQREQQLLIREISDKIVALTIKYKGLLWGEHGKGIRSEYAPDFFGELYPQLQRIKGVFDPYNQLNPGKIATPSDKQTLLKIDGVPLRGQSDRLIPVKLWQDFDDAVHCNGNAACFNWDFNDAMCPSWKATRERIHSPKGRAALVKEWLKQLEHHDYDPQSTIERPSGFLQRYKNYRLKRRNYKAYLKGEYDFSHEVMTAMRGCLACKSCAGQCPVKVNVPSFRSKFLHLYHSRYSRPLKDYLLALLEVLIPKAEKFAFFYNLSMSLGVVKRLIHRRIGLVDLPKIPNINFDKKLKKLGVEYATAEKIKTIPEQQKPLTPVIVLDCFTRYLEPELLLNYLQFLQALGFKPLIAPFLPNGKALHVHGFLEDFKVIAEKQIKHLKGYADAGFSLVGVDPAITLTYRDEYSKTLGKSNVLEVSLVQEWLIKNIEILKEKAQHFKPKSFKLLPHCTEKTNAPGSIDQWATVFHALGMELKVAAVGCCGMSGTYGHEIENRENSSKIYQQSWAKIVGENPSSGLIASGYSCRSQTVRESKTRLNHPVQALLFQFKDSDEGNIGKKKNTKKEEISTPNSDDIPTLTTIK